MKQFRIIGILFALLAIVLTACAAEQQKTDMADRKINVVTTIGMIADAAENVGGERVNVTALMGPGVDPHLYKARESDVNRMAQADVIFYNGIQLEAQMIDVFQQMSAQTKTVAVSESIDESKLLASIEYEGSHDPHVWFDVELWMIVVEAIRDNLIDMDPQSQSIYEQNTVDYLAELEELHNYAVEQANRVPEKQRVLITAHDAFQYFGEAYSFEVRGLQGISTETEAGTADVRELVDFIVEREINAIFIETSVPERNIQAVQAAVEARGHSVKIGGELFSDAMGNPETEEGTYIGMVRYNIDTIINALLDE
jgi:manganese/zinc/iron transport system substrate-binding protein